MVSKHSTTYSISSLKGQDFAADFGSHLSFTLVSYSFDVFVVFCISKVAATTFGVDNQVSCLENDFTKANFRYQVRKTI